jgi:predicted metal-binding membrane protein
MASTGPDSESIASTSDFGTSLDTAVESTLKRDRVVVLGALLAVIVFAWGYVFAGAGMDMKAAAVWNFGYACLMFTMWWVMMIAMMLPSAAPMVLLFALMNRKQKEKGNPFVPTAIFASAYLAVWAGFSIVAVVLQWSLESSALLSPMLVSENAILGGSLLLIAGIYQLTPLKQACLKHCRSPIQFILTKWRNGTGGAFRMGIEHGGYCVGCCWFLMGLLFFGGIMNLYWIAGIAIFVLLEKTIPAGHWMGHVVGVVLIIWGIVVLAGVA